MIKSLFAHDCETNGNRRFFMDRRQFSYHRAIPERRSGNDRRERIGVVTGTSIDTRKMSRGPSPVLSIIREDAYA